MSLRDAIAEHVDSVFFNTDHFAVPITYRRGGASLALTAIVGSSTFDVSSDNGWNRYQSRDYLVKASAFKFTSETTLPQVGDRIEEGNLRCVVTAPQGGSHYEYDDEDRLILRIRTVIERN